MSNGPSKQDLEMYWQSSRQYFDELAKYYQQSDPEYYKEYILPFYNNPFRSQGESPAGTTRRSSGARPLAVIAAMLVLLIAGAAAFVFVYIGSENTDKEVEKLFNSGDDKQDVKARDKDDEKSDDQKNTETDINELSPEDNFIIGSKYLGEKKYDKAEYHLKKIKPGDKYYEQSQQLLKNMKFIRKYNK
jgi:hypothetical protein